MVSSIGFTYLRFNNQFLNLHACLKNKRKKGVFNCTFHNASGPQAGSVGETK